MQASFDQFESLFASCVCHTQCWDIQNMTDAQLRLDLGLNWGNSRGGAPQNIK